MGNSKNAQSSATPTLISKGCVVTGKIESDVFVRIDGHIKGDLFIGEGLIVGEDGLIDGNINTREIVVYGTVNGTVKAESIEIKSSGKILGEIQTRTFQVERGAVYTGMVSMAKDAVVEHLVAVQ
ncbi:bactofilin family protein [Daejeonella lutea]|uniref:Protein CcmA, bactofilin family n=1 Tax=Daejeonella lutea TaxID=572036 RepID=A0A1T5EDE9_9SPHI|nr:polymer-forming cytoskeletal protein [Daejeonella lutea]SKB81830.1 protein CcmA, bactofilin family [Daejeonella lutea]